MEKVIIFLDTISVEQLTIMYKHPVLTKVPGDVAYGTEKGKQGYIQDINKLTKSELLDLKERQELLLRNK